MSHENLEGITRELVPLYASPETDCAESGLGKLPRPERVVAAHRLLIDVLLPGRMFEPDEVPFADHLAVQLRDSFDLLLPEIERALPLRGAGAAPPLSPWEEQQCEKLRFSRTAPSSAQSICEELYAALPAIRKAVIEDIAAAYRGDPAALSYAEVKLAYPGILAIVSHRIAHELYRRTVPLIPRLMSEWTHTQTGIDIHPGARIGSGFFVDHGTGVVIGETACIGNNVKIYQGAILGAKSFALDGDGNPVKHIKRHPTVEDNVVIYSNATILGGDTVIGSGSTIGGSVFLTKSVPPNTLVTNPLPELQLKREDKGQYEI